MAKRIRYRSRQKFRVRLRIIVFLTTAIVTVMSSSLFLIFQLLENEPTLAVNDPMVIGNIEVFQDTNSVLRGTSNHLVLGINIHTKGKSQHLNFSGVVLSARGTSKPVENIISNARLWTTGNTDYYTPVQQVGATVTEITDQDFRMEIQQKLLPGNNYFWVTFDIGQVAGSKTSRIDAECISVQIGTLTYEPDRSAPPGAFTLINNIPFFSTGNGDISALDSWNSSRDGSGRRLPSFNYPHATFNIQPGHILQNNLNACIPYLVIERSGVLISGSGIKTDHLEIRGGGTMIQQKAFLNPADIMNFVIRNGGTYIHKYPGRLPGNNKDFEIFSNVILNNYNTETFSEQIEWGHLVIDYNSPLNTDFSNCFKTIKGNLEIRSTGSNACLYTTTNDTINIGGSIVINGGKLALASAGNKIVLKLNKEFVLRSGGFYDAIPNKSSKGSLEFYPGTKMYLKDGEFNMSGKHSQIILNNEMVTWVQDTALVILPDVTIMPGCTLQLRGVCAGMIDEDRTFKISPTAMLSCGTTKLLGEGTFRLEENSTLSTAHPEGIFSDSTAGAIQTYKRYFSSSANYIFNGNTTPQMTGMFKTHPAENTVNYLEINKALSTNVVILQQDFRVTGRLVKENGSINKNSHKLEAGEPATAIAVP